MPGRNSEGFIEQRDIVKLMMLIAAIDIFIIVSLSVLLKNANYDMREAISFKEDTIAQSDQVKKTTKTQTEEKKTVVEDDQMETKKEYDDSIGSSMVSLYTSLIAGDHVVDGLHFYFGSEGDYAGFFDDKHKAVMGYKYEIVSDSENFLLNIYNQHLFQRHFRKDMRQHR